jgi:RNA polymerase sigma-70 factor (ECF subfamily)
MADPGDDILVRRALRADPQSFGELCSRYYPSLVAVADSVLLDHQLAEDAAQEALAEACRQLAKLKKPARFGPWVAAICRNVAKDMLRQRRRQAEPVADCAVQECDCPQDDRAAMLDQALQQLPSHLREVIFLRFYNSLSYEQMARVLGASEQTIDGRLRRAKKRIAAYLASKGFRR